MKTELLRTLDNLKAEIEAGRIVGFACVGLTEFCNAEAWIARGESPSMLLLGGIAAMQQKYRSISTDASCGVELK